MAKALIEYQKKRDFTKTSEPTGIGMRKKNKAPVFVVQEHHARRLHYDFRLEMNGVLKSWAIPKGPSLDPKDKRLAVQTEDHPLSYGAFQGTIPEGEYGAGDVLIWDKGTWEPMVDNPIKAMKEGHLKFRLNGKKLKGNFVLIKTHYQENLGRNNWLLIKERDQEGILPRKKSA